MKDSTSSSGWIGIVEPDLADRLGAAHLAPDLVTLLLVEGRQVSVEVRAGGERHDRADVLAVDVEDPALGHLARPEGRGQRVRRRVAAAQPAQVDDVPRMLGARFGEVGGDRVADGRQVVRGSQDRGVVGVVRGAEEARRSRSPARASARDPRRGASACGSRASAGSTSWRCISGTIATGAASGASAAGRTTRVSSWALAPYASHQARWKAQPEKGVAHALRAASASQVSRGMSATAARVTRRRAAEVGGDVVSRGPGQAGSASSVNGVTAKSYIGPGFRCADNRVHPRTSRARRPDRRVATGRACSMVGCRPMGPRIDTLLACSGGGTL